MNKLVLAIILCIVLLTLFLVSNVSRINQKRGPNIIPNYPVPAQQQRDASSNSLLHMLDTQLPQSVEQLYDTAVSQLKSMQREQQGSRETTTEEQASKSSSTTNFEPSAMIQELVKQWSRTVPAFFGTIHSFLLASFTSAPTMIDQVEMANAIVDGQLQDSRREKGKGQDPNRFFNIFEPVISCGTLTRVGRYANSATKINVCDAHKLTRENLNRRCQVLLVADDLDLQDWTERSAKSEKHPFMIDVLDKMKCDLTVMFRGQITPPSSSSQSSSSGQLSVVNEFVFNTTTTPWSSLVESAQVKDKRIDILKLDLNRKEMTADSVKQLFSDKILSQQLQVKLIEFQLNQIEHNYNSLVFIANVVESLRSQGYYMYSRANVDRAGLGQYFFAHRDYLLQK